MTPQIDNFLVDALHTFQVRTLRSLGFGTRVSLTNKSQEKPKYASKYQVNLTVYAPNGQIEKSLSDVARLDLGETVLLECRQWELDDGQDRILIFHLIPERLLPELGTDRTISTSREEIWSLFTAQDHYVEYYREDGFASGVLYQSGAFNYRKFSAEASTLIQAPKVCISSNTTTLLSLMHTSFEPGYDRTAALNYILMDTQANIVVRDSVSVRPFETLLIDFSEVLSKAGGAKQHASADMNFYTLYAVCQNASLLPLILNRNIAAATLSVEHSLPPMYYGQSLSLIHI